MKQKRVVPVILCGGAGSRLWPLSRTNLPKQFIKLDGKNSHSLFQQTILRLDKFTDNQEAKDIALEQALIVTNEAHRFTALEQLDEIGKSAEIILEPVGKNTAPSLTLATLHVQQHYGDSAIMLVLSADHYIADSAKFCHALYQGIKLAHNEAHCIVTLGVEPTEPATGYGYIQYQPESTKQHHRVSSFVEKPDITVAKQYLDSGDYVWNAGIFVLSVKTWLSALKQFRHDIYKSVHTSWQQKQLDTPFIRPDEGEFYQVPSESIDYAVMEHSPQSSIIVKMIKLETQWSDLGTWQAILDLAQTNAQHSVITDGDVIAIDTNDSYIKAQNRLVATLGVENLIVIETADAVLIANKSASQDLKKIISELNNQEREEQHLHRKVHRPWGWYDSVDAGERFKVKRICVKPGASLSLQKHHHRAEHWVVVKGTAEVTCGDKVMLLSENQSTYIPLGETHRLKNPGTIALEIIEVQTGSYLGEDDIVRFDDVYGRE